VDRDELAAQAVAAYEQGRSAEALGLFKKLSAADPKDATARFMVDLLSAKKGASP
jgi:hypothetical protein